jgi:hypothetical protein
MHSFRAIASSFSRYKHGRGLRSGLANGIVAALIAACGPSAAAAGLLDRDDKALPCRPTIACTADLVPPGVVELETGYLYRRLGNRAHQHSAPFLLKLTLFEWAQLQLGSNGPVLASAPAPARFFDDLTLGLKLHLIDQDDQTPSLSLSAAASLPLGEAEGYLRTWDLLAVLYVTKDLGWLHADLNLGLNLWRLEATPLPQPWVALALSVALKYGLGPMLEVYYFADAAPVSASDGGVLAALSWSPRSWLVLDLGGDVALVAATRTVSAFVGATFAPYDLWESKRERSARRAREAHER